MDLLAQKRVLFVLSSLLIQATPLAAGDDLYRLGGVDYFSVKASARKSLPPDLSLARTEAAPFLVVADLLENPNEGTARRYVAWSRERTARFMHARQLVEKVEQENGAGQKP